MNSNMRAAFTVTGYWVKGGDTQSLILSKKDPDRPPQGPFPLPKVHQPPSCITGIAASIDLRPQLLWCIGQVYFVPALV